MNSLVNYEVSEDNKGNLFLKEVTDKDPNETIAKICVYVGVIGILAIMALSSYEWWFK